MHRRATSAARAMSGRLRATTFNALVQHPNYRLYWLGAFASNIGTWVQTVAQGWLVYELTGSAFYLGAVGFATAIPNLLLALVGGVLADRFERRGLMLATQTASMLLSFLLAILTLLGLVTVWHIMAIAFAAGVVNALNAPIRQTIISDLVPRESLPNAVALNSAQFQASRTLGPAAAGVLVALVGPGWCFLLNSMSFLAMIGALLAVRLPPLPPVATGHSMGRNLLEGLSYARRDPVIFSLLLLATVPNFFAMPYTQLMPAFAASVLGMGAEGLGLLMSAPGLGALVGALAVASLGKRALNGRVLLGAIASLGICLALFSLSSYLPVSLVVLVLVGSSSMVYSALNQTFLQTLAEDRMRGRVMSLLTLATFGFQPLGSLAAGALASVSSPQLSVLVGGVVCALFALLMLATRPGVRNLG